MPQLLLVCMPEMFGSPTDHFLLLAFSFLILIQRSQVAPFLLFSYAALLEVASYLLFSLFQ